MKELEMLFATGTSLRQLERIGKELTRRNFPNKIIEINRELVPLASEDDKTYGLYTDLERVRELENEILGGIPLVDNIIDLIIYEVLESGYDDDVRNLFSNVYNPHGYPFLSRSVFGFKLSDDITYDNSCFINGRYDIRDMFSGNKELSEVIISIGIDAMFYNKRDNMVVMLSDKLSTYNDRVVYDFDNILTSLSEYYQLHPDMTPESMVYYDIHGNIAGDLDQLVFDIHANNVNNNVYIYTGTRKTFFDNILLFNKATDTVPEVFISPVFSCYDRIIFNNQEIVVPPSITIENTFSMVGDIEFLDVWNNGVIMRDIGYYRSFFKQSDDNLSVVIDTTFSLTRSVEGGDDGRSFKNDQFPTLCEDGSTCMTKLRDYYVFLEEHKLLVHYADYTDLVEVFPTNRRRYNCDYGITPEILMKRYIFDGNLEQFCDFYHISSDIINPLTTNNKKKVKKVETDN